MISLASPSGAPGDPTTPAPGSAGLKRDPAIPAPRLGNAGFQSSAFGWARLAGPLLLLAVLLVAIFFRVWHLGAVPPGLFGDEATDGLDALDVLAGRGAVFFPANYGREGLHIWIVAGMFRLLGITPLAIRLPSVVAGILTVLATYWLGLELIRAWQHNPSCCEGETSIPGSEAVGAAKHPDVIANIIPETGEREQSASRSIPNGEIGAAGAVLRRAFHSRISISAIKDTFSGGGLSLLGARLVCRGGALPVASVSTIHPPSVRGNLRYRAQSGNAAPFPSQATSAPHPAEPWWFYSGGRATRIDEGRATPPSAGNALAQGSPQPMSSFAARLLPFLPALAAAYLATSYFHVHYSRFGIRGVFTPLFGALAFAAFWHAFNLRSRDFPGPETPPVILRHRFRRGGMRSGEKLHDVILRPSPVNIGTGHLSQAEGSRLEVTQQEFLGRPAPVTLGTTQLPQAEGSHLDVTRQGEPAAPDIRPRSTDLSPYLWYALSGLFLGLSLHFYTASRFYPVFLAGFLLLDLILTLPGRRWRSSILVRDRWQIAVLFLVMLLVFAPLGWYFVQHPGSFSQRAAEVSAFHGRNPVESILHSALANVFQFFVPGRGDQAQFYNLPGRAVFDPLTAALALTGIGVLLLLVRRRPALFLLLWFPALLLPSFLATDRTPTLPRVLGTLPGVCFFPAIGLVAVLALLWLLLARTHVAQSTDRAVLAVVAAFALLMQAGLTYRDYFDVWGPSPATQDAFEVDMTQAAVWLAQNRPSDHVYLSSDIYRHPTFMLLDEHATVKTYFDLADPALSWFDARSALPLPPAGGSSIYLLPVSARPTAAAASLLDAAGAQLLRQPDAVPASPRPRAPASLLEVLRLPANAPTVPASDLNQRFTDHLTLVDARWAGVSPNAPVLQLTWQTTGPDPAGWPGYRLQVSGQAADGNTWQQDLPFDDFRAPEWVPGGRFITWRALELPAGNDSLPHHIQLRLLAGSTGDPLSTTDAPDGWHPVSVTVNRP